MDVGKRVKALRQAKGITVNKRANLSGISQSYLREIELGNKQPTVEYLEYICNGLGIDLREFFEESPMDPFRQALLRLSPIQKEKLLAFLQTL